MVPRGTPRNERPREPSRENIVGSGQGEANRRQGRVEARRRKGAIRGVEKSVPKVGTGRLESRDVSRIVNSSESLEERLPRTPLGRAEDRIPESAAKGSDDRLDPVRRFRVAGRHLVREDDRVFVDGDRGSTAGARASLAGVQWSTLSPRSSE